LSDSSVNTASLAKFVLFLQKERFIFASEYGVIIANDQPFFLQNMDMTGG